MTMIVFYNSKKELKGQIGKKLKFQETSWFKEYVSDGTFCVAGRPHITKMGREFFAQVTMKDNLIHKVV